MNDQIEQPVGEAVNVPVAVMQDILDRLKELESRDRTHGETVRSLEAGNATDSEAQERALTSARTWLAEFIVAVRGYISADMGDASGNLHGPNKEFKREAVIRMLERGIPDYWE